MLECLMLDDICDFSLYDMIGYYLEIESKKA